MGECGCEGQHTSSRATSTEGCQVSSWPRSVGCEVLWEPQPGKREQVSGLCRKSSLKATATYPPAAGALYGEIRYPWSMVLFASSSPAHPRPLACDASSYFWLSSPGTLPFMSVSRFHFLCGHLSHSPPLFGKRAGQSS